MYLRRKLDIDVPKLISVIKTHECLWSVDNRNYNRRRSLAADRAWLDVVEKVGKKGTSITKSDLRNKWKNLKDAYRKELKKHFIDNEYQGQWQYFNDLDFLRNSVVVNEKEIPEEPASDEENNGEKETYHEGMVYKRKPDPLVVKLINEVHQHECLWNKDYFPVSKPSMRKSVHAWQDIAEKLGKPLDELRRKWKNLKYSYRKEVQKHYSNGEYTGLWQYFNMLGFLKIDFVEISEDESEEEAPSPENNAFEAIEDSLPSDNNDISTQIKVEVETIDNPIDIQEYHVEPLPAKRARNDDEYDVMFLKSLVPFFRGMDPVRKLVLRSKIQDMVMNELASAS